MGLLFLECGTPCILRSTTISVFFEDITINKRLFFTHFLLQLTIASSLKNPYMVDVLLEHKKSSYG